MNVTSLESGREYIISLSEEEALHLAAVVGFVGGLGEIRETVDNLYNGLEREFYRHGFDIVDNKFNSHISRHMQLKETP